MSRQPLPGWQIWIDRGGTFTDIVARSPDGQLKSHKLLSENPELYSDAALQGIRDLLGIAQHKTIPTKKINAVKMGTTIATNALLEHRGVPTVLAITKGFSDALRIAYQNRPRLFDLNIQLPQSLYDHVVELEERLDVQGKVIVPLNLKKAEADLQKAYDKGYCALAVVLMHSYRHHDHELKIAALAEKIGYTQISLSHQVSPLMRLISRGDTTVLDAYLSPIIKEYVAAVDAELGNVNLYFMQSNGGLAEAHHFTGKNSILSGPAAGVIGAIKTTSAFGFDKIISFDMGGTSTDVAHYCGELERTSESIVSGFRLRAPMIKINTIAAGGGSVLHFRQGRYQVGPDSAGANPGPSCYRRGGPLTITDCHVMLGRLQPTYFPKVFGPKGNQSLDIEIVKEKFNAFRNTITHKTGDKRSPEQVAAGFLKIAVNNMANAIKKISVERGYDVTQYALCCFGAAAPQHACAIADELGIKTIFIHAKAGVLSAYGIGLADLCLLLEAAVEKELSEEVNATLKATLANLELEAIDKMEKQGVMKDLMQCVFSVRLRYRGTNTPLEIHYDQDSNEMIKQFEKKHKQHFGYVMPEKTITVESVAVEMTADTGEKSIALSLVTEKKKTLQPLTIIELFCDDQYLKAPVYDRAYLQVGDQINGPAMIIEANSTTIVERSWEAELKKGDYLLLQRKKIRAKQSLIASHADPVMLEVFNNLFISIADQMGSALAKTAYSANIKERLDFSCAIFDKDGHLVANAPHIPVHLGSMSESVQTIIAKRGEDLHEGDAYLLNDPYHGGTHLPDITLITPVFVEHYKKPLFFVASRAHQADIGGITPGSIPASSTIIEQEGILIDNFTLIERGQFHEKALLDLLTSGKWPARNPKQNLADIKAQIAANRKGVYELQKMIDNYGLATVEAYMQHIQNNAKSCVREVIDRLHNGKFSYAMDNGAHIDVAIHVDRKKQNAFIDFSGTSAQQNNNFNAPKAVCYAAVLYVFRTLVNIDIPLNYGCFKPLNIVIPENCFLNPAYPAAIVAGNVETSQCIVDTLYGALGIVAASQGTMNNFTFGNDTYQYYETICGGAGAGPGFHGTSAIHTHMTNSLLTDPEVLELRFPVLVSEFKIRKDSGGSGQWHGGDGVIRKITFRETMRASIVSNRRKVAPYGLAGGKSGQLGKNWLQRADGKIEILNSTAEISLLPGDTFVIETPGGGGYGEEQRNSSSL